MCISSCSAFLYKKSDPQKPGFFILACLSDTCLELIWTGTDKLDRAYCRALEMHKKSEQIWFMSKCFPQEFSVKNYF